MSRRSDRSAGRTAGFTLLEVLVAVVVLSLGIMATSKLAFQIQRAIYDNRQETAATALGTAKLAELDEYGPDNVERDGAFEEEYTGFTWHFDTKETEVESVIKVTLTIAWENNTGRLVFERLVYYQP